MITLDYVRGLDVGKTGSLVFGKLSFHVDGVILPHICDYACDDHTDPLMLEVSDKCWYA